MRPKKTKSKRLTTHFETFQELFNKNFTTQELSRLGGGALNNENVSDLVECLREKNPLQEFWQIQRKGSRS